MLRLVAALIAGAILAGCQGQQPVAVHDAWVRLPAVKGRPGAAYFTLAGGTSGATLVAVKTPGAVRTELHESMKGHAGMMTMAPVRDVAVAPGAEVRFAPGGKHLMLFDLSPGLKPGAKVRLNFAFADGTTLNTDARVVGAGDPAP